MLKGMEEAEDRDLTTFTEAKEVEITYNPSIPQSTDKQDQSQGQILTNFTQANTLFGADHVEFNNATAADRGKHKAARFIEQVADPATAADEGAVYSKNDPISGLTQLFWRGESSGIIRQLTKLPQTTIANTGTAGGSMTYIDFPFGIRLIMGLTNAFSGNFTVNTPASSGGILGYSCTANDNGTSVNGALDAGGSPPVLQIGTPASISVRYIIITGLA